MSVSSRTRAEVNQLYTEAQEVISEDEEPAQHPEVVVDFIEISSDEEPQQEPIVLFLLF